MPQFIGPNVGYWGLQPSFYRLAFWQVSESISLAGDPVKVATVEGVTEYRLDNGAKVVLFPDPSRATISVNMTVLVGSRHEGYGEAWMAHLLEHLVFKGTPTFPDIPTALKDHGADFNGTTNEDRTNYFETMPAKDANLEFGIQMESDRLVNSFIKREDLMSEFSVVRSEFERGEDNPSGVLAQRVTAAAFEWHNYGKTTIGNRSDIERVPIDNLQAFYRKYYQPYNVVLIITGKLRKRKHWALVQKYLGSIKKPDRKLDPTYTEEPAQDGERSVTLRRVGSLGSVLAAYHIPASIHPDWAPLNILASVLSEEKIGKLEEVLVESKLATNASARADNLHDPGLFSVSARPTEGNLDKVREVLLQTMEELDKAHFHPGTGRSSQGSRSQRSAESLQQFGEHDDGSQQCGCLGGLAFAFPTTRSYCRSEKLKTSIASHAPISSDTTERRYLHPCRFSTTTIHSGSSTA